MTDIRIARNREAAELDGTEVERLTELATASTFYTDALSPREVEANRRIPALARQVYFQAAGSQHQHLAAAFCGKRLAGFMIATRHDQDGHELDWLMVGPDHQGCGVAARLMVEGMTWLGLDEPMWLTVIRHNQRAIRFYRKFGFAIDADARLDRPVPTWIMRRPGGHACLDAQLAEAGTLAP